MAISAEGGGLKVSAGIIRESVTNYALYKEGQRVLPAGFNGEAVALLSHSDCDSSPKNVLQLANLDDREEEIFVSLGSPRRRHRVLCSGCWL